MVSRSVVVYFLLDAGVHFLLTRCGVLIGLLIASVTSLNVTISIVLQLGDAIAGVASGLADTDVSALSDFGGGVALPVMEDSSSVGENIRMFKIVVSILI